MAKEDINETTNSNTLENEVKATEKADAAKVQKKKRRKTVQELRNESRSYTHEFDQPFTYNGTTVEKPIRGSVEYNVIRRLHSDGTVEIIPEYQVFPVAPIGERHMFNVYGEKAAEGQTAGV